MTPPLTGLGRDVLLRMIADLVKERDDLAANLTATQARCTELLEECRAWRRARCLAAHALSMVVDALEAPGRPAAPLAAPADDPPSGAV